ncbi:ion transporter [Candidatus Woesearchaeota archaeon]|nr:ion transporter [Candidatus Woesearchaeota archaeon]
MNVYTRIGMYFFIIGALLCVLDGAFLVTEDVRGLVYIALIFLGIFAGLLNITEDEEHHFLVSASAFLIVIMAFNVLFAGDPMLSGLTHFFQNAVAFVGSMALGIAIKTILEFGSQNYHVTPVENMAARTAEIDDWDLPKKLKVWYFIVFLAVCITFIIILLGLPIYNLPQGAQQVFNVLEWFVIAVFVIDLVVLYKHEDSIGSFFKNCWIDIVAAIPIPGIFGFLKIVRLSRVARVTHSMKFFSKKSGVNTYLRKSQRRVEPIEVQAHPRAEQKVSASRKVTHKKSVKSAKSAKRRR